MSRTLAQALASIGESISMVNGIKNDIRLAIEAQGVGVPDGTAFASYPNLIAAIHGGGSGGMAGFNLPPRFCYASYKRRITLKKGTILPLAVQDETKYFIAADDIEINVQDILEAESLEAGKDYYLFLVPDNTNPAGVNIKASQIKDAPNGFIASEVFRFGGFHTLCENVGTGLTYHEGERNMNVIKDHPLNGYITGDILPQSVWCLNHRPYSEPEGMVYIPTLDFWCDIYLQSGSGANTKSAYQGAITRDRIYENVVEDQFCVKKALLNDEEFSAAMLGSNECSAVLGMSFEQFDISEAAATAGGAGGRKDMYYRRMISIYGVEEGCGSLYQWLATTSAGGGGGWNFGGIKTGGKGSTCGFSYVVLAGGGFDMNTARDFFGSRCRVMMETRYSSRANCSSRGRSHNIRVFVDS